MVKKKKKTVRNVIFSILVIGIIVTALLITGIVPQVTYGSTYLSIDDIDIIDDGARIRIYAVTNGAEQMLIDFSKSEINEYIEDDGYAVTESVTGSITMSNPTREFKLYKDETKNFYKFQYLSLNIFQNCENNKPAGNISVGRIATSTCLYYSSLGTYSTFTGTTIDNTPVNINIDGATGVLNPSSGTNVLTLNDGKIKIEWVGNLVNFVGLNTPYQYAALFSGSQYDKLIDSGAYNSQQVHLNTFTDCLGADRITQSLLVNFILGLFKSDDNARACMNTFNNRLATTLVDKTSTYINSVNIDGAEFTSNGLEIELKTATAFPTFIITLDASTVGIMELEGEPDIITCPSNKAINSGETYSTGVTVKNIGSSDGSFYGQLTCSGSSDAGGTITEQYVKAGETVNIPIQVSGINIVSGTQSNTCTIKIIDRKSQDYDTCSFILSVKYQENIICTPDAITCKDVDTLKTCNSDGTDFTTKNCEFGCIVLEDGSAQCKEEDLPPSIECPFGQEQREEGDRLFGIFPGKPAGCYTASWILTMIGVAGLVVLITIIVIIKRIFK